MKKFLRLLLILSFHVIVPTVVIAQQNCQIFEDNYMCYTGVYGCSESQAHVSAAGQSGIVGQYNCSVSAISYFGVCDSGNSPQDDQFVLDINGQVVSENFISTQSEFVNIYPITLGAGNYSIRLSVLRDADPPGTYRVVASTSAEEVSNRLRDVCGADFAATSFEEEGAGRLINEPIPILVYASYRQDFNGDGVFNNTDGASLFLYDAFQNIEVQLTDSGSADFDPAWSPEGQTIVFASQRRGLGIESAIYTVPVTGGQPQQITDGTVSHWHPEFSPDGQTIATTCYRNSICLMNRDGSNLRTILQSDGSSNFYWDPQWSPNGSQLLILGRTQDTNGSGRVDGCDQSMLFIINQNGSGLQRISSGGNYIFGGDWSLDGTQIIYYAAWETGNGHECAYNDEAALGIIDVQSRNDTILIPRGRFLRTPAFSHDTSFATYTAPNRDDNGDGYLDARDTESLVVFLFNDGTQRRLTLGNHEIFDPSWAPIHITTLQPVNLHVRPTSICNISASQRVNLRSSPSTDASSPGRLPTGYHAADGQQRDNEGFVWWRLANGYWVRSDVVDATGNCNGLPQVSSP